MNNRWDVFHLDLKKLKVILQKKKEYPPKLIHKSVNRYLNTKIMKKPNETEPSKTKENIRYFKLPFVEKFSKFTENKLQKLAKQFCKEVTNINIVFSAFKLACLFSTKAKLPHGLKSYVIYKFLSAGCNVSYVGETFLPGLVNIWKLIKVLRFTNTLLKIRNVNQFVMRTVFQF